MRAIAADAGISAGLIVHHFGSRAGLRAACNDHVLDQVRSSKSDVLSPHGAPAALFAQLAQLAQYAPLFGYVLRNLQAGGELTVSFVDDMVEETLSYLEDGVRAGTVRPSRDPRARARVLIEMGLGALLLQLPGRNEPLDPDSLPDRLSAYTEQIMLPMLELYTEPLLTDSTLLDAYVAATEPTGDHHD